MNLMPRPDAAFRALGPLPAGHPPVKTGKIGVLLLNLGTPDATDYWSMRRYLKEFLSDRRVIETPRLLWWPILNLIILTRPARAEGQGLRSDLEQGAERRPAADHHPVAGRAAGRAVVRAGRPHRGRLGHALRQPVHALPHQVADGTGLRPHPARAALPAVLRGDLRDGLRQGVRGADGDALAARRPRRAALARRPRLYRRARQDSARKARRDRFRARHARGSPSTAFRWNTS